MTKATIQLLPLGKHKAVEARAKHRDEIVLHSLSLSNGSQLTRTTDGE